MTDSTDDSGDVFGTLLASGGILFVGLVVQMGTNFFTKVVVARLLGEADYGAVSLGFTILTTLSILATAGVDTGIGRFLPRFDETPKRRGVLVSAFVAIVPLAVLLGVGTALGADYLATTAFSDPSIAPVIRVFALTIPVAVFVRLTIGSVRGMKEAIPRVVIQNVSLPVVRLGLVVGVIAAGGGVVAVSWGYAAAYLLAAGLSLYYLYARTSLFERVEVEFMHRRLLLFSLPLMVTTAMKMLLSNLDKIVIGVFGTTADVGAYNVAYPLAALLAIALSAFGFVFMPVVSGMDADDRGGEFTLAYQVVSKWIFVVSFPLLLTAVTFPRTSIGVTFGSTYGRADLALVVLAVGFFTHSITGPSGNALTALGKTRVIMLDNVAVAVVNLLLNVALVPQYSLLGAAVATAVSYGLLNALYLTQLYRATGAHPFRAATAVPGVAAGLAWGGLYLATGTFTEGAWRLLTSVVVFALAYPVVFVLFGGVEEAELWALDAFEDRFGTDLSRVRSVLERLAR